MATPFNDIYTVFYSNITSYKLAKLPDDVLEEELEQWMYNGLIYFTMARTNIYNFNKLKKEFNCDLTFHEVQIIGKSMTLAFMNTFLLDEKAMTSVMSSKDVRSYSPAKHLDSLRQIYTHCKRDLDGLMSRYSYNSESIKAFMKGGK